MSACLNKVSLIGYLGADPEIRQTSDGKSIANLRVATSESWRDRHNGERRERTEWHRVVIFVEGLAKVAEKYLSKGSRVYLEGQLQTHKWTDRDGIDRYTTEVVMQPYKSTLTMLDRRNRNGDGGNEPSNDDFGSGSGGGGDLDDEIPF